jgi:hypothetical protein
MTSFSGLSLRISVPMVLLINTQGTELGLGQGYIGGC